MTEPFLADLQLEVNSDWAGSWLKVVSSSHSLECHPTIQTGAYSDTVANDGGFRLREDYAMSYDLNSAVGVAF